jgi:hypothetical protein
VASCDVQGRFVRRDDFVPVVNDMEGEDREGWYFEYHNIYCDVINPLSHVVSPDAASALVGALNFRLGRFYLPLGLNLQTDTHGTVLQLSNEENLGFERDWYAGFWGGIGRYAKYDLYYLTGSGYDLEYHGQSGMIGLRVGTSAALTNEYGVEAGIAGLAGQRLSSHGGESVDTEPIDIVRYGPDLRYTLPTTWGSFSLTNEINGGLDDGNRVLMDLHQLGYLHNSRRYGTNVQWRRIWRESGDDADTAASAIFYDITYYLSNDLGSSNLHWLNVDVEQKLEHGDSGGGVVVSLQYYRYW